MSFVEFISDSRGSSGDGVVVIVVFVEKVDDS